MRPVVAGQPPRGLLLILSRVGALTTFLLILAAIYAIVVISNEVAEKAKIQENAMLAGLVEESWRDSAKLQHYLRGLRQASLEPRPRSALRAFLSNSFAKMGVEVYRQPFKCSASSFVRPNSSFCSGDNVFAIIRSFRAIPAEAILMTVPMRTSRLQSMAVALALADHSRNQLYWARDLIFLFLDGGDRLAAEAWLSAYHGHPHSSFSFFEQPKEELPAHAGAIISAFGLDLDGDLFGNVELQYGMVNGKLPNMDLLNLFTLLVEKAGSVPSINGVVCWSAQYDHWDAAKTVGRGIVGQSLDELVPLTSVFGRFGLHALTVKGHPAFQERHSSSVDLADMVRIMEGALRSLNNLLEKFHHSYQLYVLTHPHRFVPAALYMPLLGLLLSPLLLLGLREWFRLGGAANLGSTRTALFPLGLCHLLPVAFYALQSILYMDPRLSARSHVAPLNALLFPLLLFSVPPLSALCWISRSIPAAVHFLRFTVSLELALFLAALGLFHFSLALLLSVLLIPLCLASLLLSVRCPLPVRWLLFLLLHPFSIALFFFLVTNPCAGLSFADCRLWLIARVTKMALAHFAHGSWLLPLLSGPVMAICLCMGQTMFVVNKQQVEQQKEKHEKEE